MRKSFLLVGVVAVSLALANCSMINSVLGLGSSDETFLRDDSYENNDSFYSAASLSYTGTYSNLISNDEDWYRVDVPSGYSTVSVSMNYTSSAGDLDVELYDSSGYWLDSSEGTSGYESIVYGGSSSGTYYYVRVYHYSSYTDNQTYSLSWTYY